MLEFAAAAAVVILALLTVVLFKQRSSDSSAVHSRRYVVLDCIRTVTEAHRATLARKRSQLLRFDDYGNIDRSAWDREIEYFIRSVVLRDLDPEYRGLVSSLKLDIATLVNSVVDGVQELTDITSFRDELTPVEYEHFCAGILRQSGWTAQVTKGSGDQGVDVIGDMGGIRIVLQCKKYSGNVGNKAVQEIIAGKQFEGAQYAAVVSNAPFTPLARQLAQRSGVLLLHHSDLAAALHQIVPREIATPEERLPTSESQLSATIPIRDETEATTRIESLSRRLEAARKKRSNRSL